MAKQKPPAAPFAGGLDPDDRPPASDADGRPFANSAGEPFDPPPEVVRSDAPGSPPADETADQKLARLERENADLRARLGVAAVPAAAAGGTAWVGSIPKDPLAPALAFAAGPSEAEAREAYLRAAGITATEHPVHVRRA